MILHNIFEVEIITSSVCFAEILHHCIILHQLSTCCIKPTVRRSIRYFSCQYNWVAFLLLGHLYYPLIIGASLSKPHTVSSQFNRGTMVAYPKVYITISTEGLAHRVAYSVHCTVWQTELKLQDNGTMTVYTSKLQCYSHEAGACANVCMM